MRPFLILLVFVGGMVSLALEMCAERLLEAYFGSSLLTWALLIGTILFSLTIGYFLGGKLADYAPSAQVLCTLTALAGFIISLLSFVCPAILNRLGDGDLWSASSDVLAATFLGEIILFALPVALLSFISPFALRLLSHEGGRSGRLSGSLYAISTLGSLLGVFLPVLFLIPRVGVRRSLLLFGLLIFAASLWGLHRFWRFLVVIPLILMVLPLGPLKVNSHLLYEKESSYNYIQVIQLPDGTRQLLLNGDDGIHSVSYSDHNRILTGRYWDYFMAAPYFNPGFQKHQLQRVGIIGLAGGTIARQFTQVYGPVAIDGVELDLEIVNAGRQYFDMNEPNLHVYIQDGRTFLATTQNKYDVLTMDAFNQGYIPFQLTTREFFYLVRDHLSPTGVVVLNAFHTSDYRLVQVFVNTLSQVFPSVYTFDVPGTFNTEIVATMRPTSQESFRANMAQFSPDEVMGQLAKEVVPVARQGRSNGGLIFTDDRAPVELLSDLIIMH